MSTTQTMHLLIQQMNNLLRLWAEGNGRPLDPFLQKVDKGKIQWIIHASEEILGFIAQFEQ